MHTKDPSSPCPEEQMGVYTRRRASTAVITAIVVLAFSGCGGSDETADSPPAERATGEGPPLTKEEFVRRADEICRDANTQLEPIEDRIDSLGSGDYDELASELRTGLGIADQQLEDLRELTPPRADQETVDQLVQAVEAQVAVGRRLAGAAGRRDALGLSSLAGDFQRARARAEELAQGYGFDECGGGS